MDSSVQSILDGFDNINSNDSLTDTDKLKLTQEILDKFKKFKTCKACDSFFTTSCDFCMRKYLENRFDKWDSGDDEINRLIQNYQMKIVRPENILEWIPYNDLQDFKFTSEGGFLFKIRALWVEGRYTSWDAEERELKRYGPQSVTIKYVTKDSDLEQWEEQWLLEIKAHLLLSSNNSPVMRSFGLTSDGNSYMVITENVTINLRKHLQDKAYLLTWAQKYKILLDILDSLGSVHKNGLIHGDLHTGTIWYSTSREIWLIGDFRYCRPVDNPANKSYGTMSYVAPEMLSEQKEQMTTSSDIYSFAMIMWEVATSHRPFYDRLENPDLSDYIRNEGRPEISEETPKRYSKIMKSCWDNEPSKRPKLVDIQNEIKDILNDFFKNSMSKEEDNEMKSMIKRKNPIINDIKNKPNEGNRSIIIYEQRQIKDEKFVVGKISSATISSDKVAIKTLRINKSDKINKSMISQLSTSLQERVDKLHDVYQHTNIVKILGAGIRDEAKLFLVMPFADGGNLRDYLKDKGKDLFFDEKIKIARDITNGITKLHDHNIVHENINPINILVFGGTAKISNLPLPFKEPQEINAFKNKDLYVNHDLFDSIGYVDPNCFKGNLKNDKNDSKYKSDKSVDIYSLGTLLWEIMSGKIPYQDDESMDGGIVKLIMKIKGGHREKSDIPGVPDKYIKLYEECWDGDSSKRPKINYVHEKLKNIS